MIIPHARNMAWKRILAGLCAEVFAGSSCPDEDVCSRRFDRLSMVLRSGGHRLVV
jgi:hypothetical protein